MCKIKWRLHLASPPDEVYQVLITADGRETFWAESANERDGVINFVFTNGEMYRSRIVESIPHERVVLEYFGGLASFALVHDGTGGTDLMLTHDGIPDAEVSDTSAGWVSVLLALKAAVDYGVDLRNHDNTRTWDAGYVDN